MAKRLNTREAAKTVGIARHTLQRWIREGRVKPPNVILRDGRAVRIWSPLDVKRLAQTKANTYRKGRGPKPKRKR